MYIRLVIRHISCYSALPDLTNGACPYHLTKRSFHRGRADIRQDAVDLRLGQRCQAIQNGSFDTSLLRYPLAMYDRETLVQLLVAHIERREEVFRERKVIVPVIVPAYGGLVQGLIFLCKEHYGRPYTVAARNTVCTKQKEPFERYQKDRQMALLFIRHPKLSKMV